MSSRFSEDNLLELEIAKRRPERWAGLIMRLAARDPHQARVEADIVRSQEIDHGFRNSPICIAATAALEVMNERQGRPSAALLPVNASMDFYRTPKAKKASSMKLVKPRGRKSTQSSGPF